MKKCPFCGALNPNTESFCSSCGGPLENAEYVRSEDPKTSSENESQKSAGTSDATDDSTGSVSSDFSGNSKAVKSQSVKAFLLCIIAVCTIGLIILLPRLFGSSGEHDHLIDPSPNTSETISDQISDNNPGTETSDSNSVTQTSGSSLEAASSSGNTDDRKKTYPGYVDLERNKETSVDLSGNGTSDTFYYTADIIDDGAKSITLTVNGKETDFDLSDSPLYITYLGVCAADINLNDDYRNILIFKSQYTEVYTYDNAGNLTLIAELHGAVKPEKLDGSGKLVYYHTGILSDREGNSLVSEYIGNVAGKTYSPVSDRTGVLLGATKSQFVEGFTYTLYKDVPTYEDNLLSVPTGISIPSGSTIDIKEYYDRGGRPMTWTYRVRWNDRDLWIGSPDDY